MEIKTSLGSHMQDRSNLKTGVVIEDFVFSNKQREIGHTKLIDSEMARYYIFAIVALILLFIICIIGWHFCGQYRERRRNCRVIELQSRCSPESIVRAEIEKLLTDVKYEAPKDVESAEQCSICHEAFTDGGVVSRTPCHHLFHSVCLWQWIDTKVKGAIETAARDLEILNGHPEMRPYWHPPRNCVECPLCNQHLLESEAQERRNKQRELLVHEGFEPYDGLGEFDSPEPLRGNQAPNQLLNPAQEVQDETQVQQVQREATMVQHLMREQNGDYGNE